MPAYQDPILAEVRKIRTEIAKENNYDFHSYCKKLRAKRSSMEKSGWKFALPISNGINTKSGK